MMKRIKTLREEWRDMPNHLQKKALRNLFFARPIGQEEELLRGYKEEFENHIGKIMMFDVDLSPKFWWVGWGKTLRDILYDCFNVEIKQGIDRRPWILFEDCTDTTDRNLLEDAGAVRVAINAYREFNGGKKNVSIQEATNNITPDMYLAVEFGIREMFKLVTETFTSGKKAYSLAECSDVTEKFKDIVVGYKK